MSDSVDSLAVSSARLSITRWHERLQRFDLFIGHAAGRDFMDLGIHRREDQLELAGAWGQMDEGLAPVVRRLLARDEARLLQPLSATTVVGSRMPTRSLSSR